MPRRGTVVPEALLDALPPLFPNAKSVPRSWFIKGLPIAQHALVLPIPLPFIATLFWALPLPLRKYDDDDDDDNASHPKKTL
jgi:hypothetical protein